jgi:integrase
MPPDFRQLARGALYTGLRLGELLTLAVSDVGDGQVHVRHSKGGKERTVPLSREGAEFFDQITAGNPGDALACSRLRVRPVSGSTPADT